MSKEVTLEEKVKIIEKRISLLTKTFQENPLNFFHEKEIHSLFYTICNDDIFWKAKPRDYDKSINLFRQEYNTIWRYMRKDENNMAFSNRYEDKGKAGSLDFAVLKQDFVNSNNLLTVINKDEKKRKKIRTPEDNPAIDIGIEFKMAHITNVPNISEGKINTLRNEVLIDCRKLAHERIPFSYIIAVSHGGYINQKIANEIKVDCIKEFESYNKKDKIRIIIINPKFSTNNF